ncbi:unnamed protein product [Spirodela intermedia]|uniref:BHLH domain-containing protein n=1 Tax=Spirodela intermedia TaxID=51605 RepID=A0A7I8JJY4_SPIIN|nr:unnamed protein product [Spirodela intermedia]CAA6670095.1 unnamed protein product [Spirodela intermedia]
MVTASRSNGGFAEGEDDIFVKEEFNHKERTVNVDVGNTSDNNNEQQPSTPRSKHSATEQRRRTKINERFRTLKDLIPPNDQKRDKASLLLEVIEYIRFLQEKVQTYESSCPARTQDGAKLTPWRARQDSATAAADHPPPAPPFSPPRRRPGRPRQADWAPMTGGGGGGGVTPQQQAARWSPSGGRDEQVMIPAADEGLSNLSTLYSQGLVTRLTQALEGSGVDLTQASVSVRVNLGRGPRRASRDAHSRGSPRIFFGFCFEQTEPPPDRPGKRLKPDAS